MKKILHKIGVYSLASFVLFLSIGFNISKISCHEKSIIAIGDSQSTCHEDVNNICVFICFILEIICNLGLNE